MTDHYARYGGNEPSKLPRFSIVSELPDMKFTDYATKIGADYGDNYIVGSGELDEIEISSDLTKQILVAGGIEPTENLIGPRTASTVEAGLRDLFRDIDPKRRKNAIAPKVLPPNVKKHRNRVRVRGGVDMLDTHVLETTVGGEPSKRLCDVSDEILYECPNSDTEFDDEFVGSGDTILSENTADMDYQNAKIIEGMAEPVISHKTPTFSERSNRIALNVGMLMGSESVVLVGADDPSDDTPSGDTPSDDTPSDDTIYMISDALIPEGKAGGIDLIRKSTESIKQVKERAAKAVKTAVKTAKTTLASIKDTAIVTVKTAVDTAVATAVTQKIGASTAHLSMSSGNDIVDDNIADITDDMLIEQVDNSDDNSDVQSIYVNNITDAIVN
jgi:hypothetical protein